MPIYLKYITIYITINEQIQKNTPKQSPVVSDPNTLRQINFKKSLCNTDKFVHYFKFAHS